MDHDETGNEGKLDRLYEGPVVDNVDPLKQGRVRVLLPGVAEPTGWARPYGWGGAGGKQRGGFYPPPIGAEVGVMFIQGNPDQPRYLCGFPGDGESPQEVLDDTPANAVLVQKFETDRWFFIIDDRPGKERIALVDKKTNDVYEIDGVGCGINISATTAVNIVAKGAIVLDAPSVTIKGRKVTPSSKPL